jgi:hypothetical protein
VSTELHIRWQAKQAKILKSLRDVKDAGKEMLKFEAEEFLVESTDRCVKGKRRRQKVGRANESTGHALEDRVFKLEWVWLVGWSVSGLGSLFLVAF